MRCISCDSLLTEFESTRRSGRTNEFLDICSRCLYDVEDDITVIDRLDLKHASDEMYYGVEELDFGSLTFTNDFKEEFE
jgi:hypothetical protein